MSQCEGDVKSVAADGECSGTRAFTYDPRFDHSESSALQRALDRERRARDKAAVVLESRIFRETTRDLATPGEVPPRPEPQRHMDRAREAGESYLDPVDFSDE